LGDGIQDVMEGIEIHFDQDEGHLRLDCSEQEFRHIRELVVSGASAADRLSPFIDAIRFITVRRMAAVQDTTPRRFRRGLQILLISLLLSVALVIQVIGIIAVARWLLGRGS
jgi:hypothetical protein